ncbi:MAG: metallophosphoesterase, partial [Elusimicrobia bacterium]|nr:metallophosphoesterase [Elusimicrobiota bacterium]
VILIYLGMQCYAFSWTIRSFPALGLNVNAARAAAALLAASFPLSLYWLRLRPGSWTCAFAYVSCLWLGIAFVWASWAALADLCAGAARLVGAAQRLRAPIAPAAAALAAACIAWSLLNAARLPRVHDLELELANLPPELDGFTVVELSDIHLGLSLSPERFARIVERASALDADVIVLAGDILDAGMDGQAEAARIGAGLKARRGVFAVLGNHEFYHGAAESTRTFQAMGARVLRGEVAVLPGGLQIAGVDDIRTARISRTEVDRLLAGLDPGRPSLFLSHQPLDFEVAAARGVGLMLSGHTHHGQIFPFGLVTRIFYRYVRGLFRREGSWLYVGAGAGHWGPPMRLLSRSEIVRVRLRAPQRPADQARRTRPAASGS